MGPCLQSATREYPTYPLGRECLNVIKVIFIKKAEIIFDETMIIKEIIEKFDKWVKEGEYFLATERMKGSGYDPPLNELDENTVVEYTRWAAECSNAIFKLFGKNSDLFKKFTENNGSIEESIIENVPEDFYNYMRVQLGYVKAARNRLNDDILFKFREPIIIEIFGSILDQGKHFLKSGYKDIAAIYGRIVLENELREQCKREKVILEKEKPTLGDYNDALRKVGYLKTHEWRSIQRWADIGNAAAHGKFKEYAKKDVREMLNWISDFVKG